MSDDILAGGMIPDNDASDDDEFDPDAVDSDDFLDDSDEELDTLDDVPAGLLDDEEEDDDLTRNDM